MALKEQDIVFHTKDSNGNTVLQLPITRVENVEGAIKTVNGNSPDSDGNIVPSHTGCLPLAGGNMTGTIAARHSIDDATAVPSSNQYQTALTLKDNNNLEFGHLQTASYADSGKLLIKLAVADGVRNGNTYGDGPATHFIGVGMDASGTPYTIAPNPPAGDDSDQIATTAWVRNTVDAMIDDEGVVHIAGRETISGEKTFSATTTFNGVVNLNATVIGGAGRDIWVAHASGETANRSVIQSGNAYADGASFYLNAKDYATNGGAFQINAHDGTNVKTLLGKPDGTLTWSGKNIVRSVNNVAADAAGNVPLATVATSGSYNDLSNKPTIPATPKAYVTETWKNGTSWYRKWSDGWIEQGGYAYTPTAAGGTDAGASTLTFPQAFSDTNYTITCTGQDDATDDGDWYIAFAKKTKTGIGVHTRFWHCHWYACGY